MEACMIAPFPIDATWHASFPLLWLLLRSLSVNEMQPAGKTAEVTFEAVLSN